MLGAVPTVDETATLTAIIGVGNRRIVYGRVTIDKNMQVSCGSVLEWYDNASMEVNGLLTLAMGTPVADIENHITGSGIVRIEMRVNDNGDAIEWNAYYTDCTPVLHHRSDGLNFSQSETDGKWNLGATLAANGYTITGNAENGYVLTLGDLVIVGGFADIPAINLPKDGKVEVKLVGDTRVYSNGVAMGFGKDHDTQAEYPCTISGSGSLLMVGSGHSTLNSAQPLTITGGNITATSFANMNGTSRGVNAPNLTISGGALTASGKTCAFDYAPSFSDYTPRVTYGDSAATATTKRSPAAAVYTDNKFVRIEQYIAPSGGSESSVFTLSFEVNGGSALARIVNNKGITIELSSYVSTRENFIFDGWYSDEALTRKVTSVKLAGNTTVYAKWSDANLSFSDVSENDWFYGDIAYVYAAGLMQGADDATFNPHGTTTRGMIVTILYRLAGQPAVTGDCPFEDVESGKYYENAIIWAAANKIVDGYENGKFGPEDPITREQMATILYRYEQHKGGGFTGAWMFLLDFPDADKVSEWAYEAMCWCTMNGVITGSDGGALVPQGSAERCQVAAILHRFCEK